jgi:hypothetical protein
MQVEVNNISSVPMVIIAKRLTIELRNFIILKSTKLNSVKHILRELKVVIMEICVLLLILKRK